MDSEVICLDSDEEEMPQKNGSVENAEPSIQEASPVVVEINESPVKEIRRITPMKIGNVEPKSEQKSSDSEQEVEVKSEDPEPTPITDEAPPVTNDIEIKQENQVNLATNSNLRLGVKNDLTEEFEKFIKACKIAEPSEELKKAIRKKLLKYYHEVHPSFVTSREFLKLLNQTAEEIRRAPHYVFQKIKIIVEELQARRNFTFAVPLPVQQEPSSDPQPSTSTADQPSTSTADQPSTSADASANEFKNVDKQTQITLKQLNRALVKAKRRIEELEEEEVDWDDDDNSAYLKKIRYEKRACEIYKKMCELTGESSDAHRVVKKPISLKKTKNYSLYPEFYKQLAKSVNKPGKNYRFPYFRFVLRTFDYCNKKYGYKVPQQQHSRIAQDAFETLGNALQERRRTDFYESARHYVGDQKDPAKTDPELNVLLEKNKKFRAKIDDIVNEYVLKAEKSGSDDNAEVSSTSKIDDIKKENDDDDDEDTEEEEEKMEVSDIEESIEEPKKSEDEEKSKKPDLVDDDDDDLMIIS